MEGPDGYMRTVSAGNDKAKLQQDDVLSCEGSDSENSEMQFASDEQADDKGGKEQNFFNEGTAASASAPSPWNFENARDTARAPQPFQTTIDAKIRSARQKFTVELPETDTIDEKEKVKKNENENDDGDDDSDDDSDDDGEEELKSDNKSSVNKTRKRKKKTTSSESTATFMDLHLSKPLQKAIQVLEWTKPTPIQNRTIPYILAGRDICASAVTGSGKTGAFLLPIIERLLQAGIDNLTRVIILLPTRELAAQCHSVLQSLAKYTAVRSALVVGGLNSEMQQVALRTKPHIIIATPGRLIDHIRNSHGFTLEGIEVLVLDEGDRLLDMGFTAEVEEILKAIPLHQRQTLLFSATITPKLQSLIRLSLKKAVNIAVDQVNNVANELSQEFVKIRNGFEDCKDALLLSLVTRTYLTSCIIFFRQKVSAHRMKILFGLANLKCSELHGNLTQAQRLSALDDFKDGSVNFLLCTDLAARGLDIIGVDTVINYDMPGDIREYVHRVGRTARAGRIGTACSLICTSVNDERKLIKTISKQRGKKLAARVVPVKVIGKWKAWIMSVGKAVKDILKEERHERELRMAEMEVKKAENIIKYSDDIYGRPAKTWFRSEDDKLEEEGKVRKSLGLKELKRNDGGQNRTAVRKRKMEDAEKRKENLDKRRKTQSIIARQEDYGQQRMDARKQKRKQGPGKRR